VQRAACREETVQLPRRHILRLATASLALPFVVRRASAETYPAKPIRMFVGFPAGGQVDIIARLVGQGLGERIGQTVVIENKPGAGGNLGAQALIGSPPDGYTLFFATSANVINTTLFANLPYDFARDVTAVAPVNRIPLVLQVNPSFPAKNLTEFIAYAKANPGKVNIASPSAGTPPYLCVDLLKMMAGIDVTHVPYFGENQMVTDLLGGQVLAGFGGISPVMGHFKAGKLIALGVTSATRVQELPDVPTIGETVSGFEASGWSGVVAPKNTPLDIVDRLATAIHDLQTDPNFAGKLAEFGVTLLTMSPAEFAKFITNETDKWGKVVKFAGLKPG
jgi:tripartite-type tricarboxylate transporter receptor subunit TctC